MATIKDQNEDQQDSGQLGSQASATVSGGAGGMAQPSATPQGKSGNFVNLGRYMTANEGNEAVQSSIGDINAKGDQAQQAFTGAKDNFESLKVDAPQDLNQEDKNYLSNSNPKNFSYSLDSNGNATNADQQRVGKNLAGIQYSGPSTGEIDKNYQDYAKAKSGVDDAGRLFEASPNGVAQRQQQLTQTNTQRANGNYGGGMARFDSALVEHQGTSAFDPQRQALSQMAGGYGDGAAVASKAKTLSQQAANAQSIADTAKNTYQPQFQNIQNTMNSAASANRYGAFGGGSASQNGTFAAPHFGAATSQSIAAANRPTPVAAPAPKPTSNATPYDAEEARKSRTQ